MSDQHSETAAQTRRVDVAEYVLGTLDAHNRAQIDKALALDSDLRRELDYWQQRLGSLCLAIPPVEPPAGVWQAIRDQAGLDSPRVVPHAKNAASSRSGTATRRRRRFWPGLAVAASLVAVVLAAVLFNTSAVNPNAGAAAPAYASVVYDEPTGMSWRMTGSAQPEMLSVSASGQFPLPPGKVLRAWIKPDDGPAVFLGPWPHTQGKHSLSVSAAATAKLAHASRLVITMEDAGKAVEPAPTGRIMWTSPIARQTG